MAQVSDAVGVAESAELIIVIPMLPGKSEAWRRTMQELTGSRRADFDDALERWGIVTLSLYLASTCVGHVVVARLTSSDSPIDLQLRIGASREVFDRWLIGRISVFHGIELYGPATGHVAERIFP